MKFFSADNPLIPWLYYVATLTFMYAWMSTGYANGFDVMKDGPALLFFASGIAGLDLFNRWKHGKTMKARDQQDHDEG